MPQSAVSLLWTIQSKLVADDDMFSFVSMLAEAHVDGPLVEAELQQLRKSLSCVEGTHDHFQMQQRLFSKASKLKLLVTPLWETWLAQSLHSHLASIFQFRSRLLTLKAACDAHHHNESPLPHDPQSELWRRRRSCVVAVDATLQRLLVEWFSSTKLILRELTWNNTAASVVEQIIAAERVHPFEGFGDAKARMAPAVNRRLFALFHAGVEGPLVAVQVALTRGVESSVDRILGRHLPPHLGLPDDTTQFASDEPCDTAMFYSINSTQEALRGIDLGNSLIKQAVSHLQTPGGSIRTFSTLSPIPGYAAWLQNMVNKMERGQPGRLFGICSPSVEERYFEQLRRAFGAPLTNEQLAFNLMSVIDDDREPWWLDDDFAETLREPLMRSIAWYLTGEKRRNKVLDPVGNFHVSNGAQIYRLNWLANCTAKGNRESGCVMVNYLYNLSTVEQNSHEYQLHHRVDTSAEVTRILSQ